VLGVFDGRHLQVGERGKTIDDDVTTNALARLLILPPWWPKVTESLVVNVREAARICRHDSTLASNGQGSDNFDTIACEAETIVEPVELPCRKNSLSCRTAAADFFCSLATVEVGLLPNAFDKLFRNLVSSGFGPVSAGVVFEAARFLDVFPAGVADVEARFGFPEAELGRRERLGMSELRSARYEPSSKVSWFKSVSATTPGQGATEPTIHVFWLSGIHCGWIPVK